VVALKGSPIRLVLFVEPGGSERDLALRLWCEKIAAHDGACVAWMSLERSDNLPEAFLVHLDQALAAATSPKGTMQEWNDQAGREDHSLAPGRVPAHENLEDALTGLLNRLVDLPEELLLVMDEYQEIDSPEIHRAVSLMLEYLPPQVHLVIGSRSVPPLPLARLRVRRQVLEMV
jgi:LuxR family maltose regulon positive regulatory protein